MANKTITMHLLRRLIQLLERGYSERRIANELHISRPTVKAYKIRLHASGLDYQELKSLSDKDLATIIYHTPVKEKASDERRLDFEKRIEYFTSELKRTGVTRKLLWEEYRGDNPPDGGYSFTQFCHLFAQFNQKLNPSMTITYNPGEKVLVDFAGDKMFYTDRKTGEVFECPILVCMMPYSGYSYVEALPNASLPQLIKGLNNMLHYFGGIPKIFKTDNMKQVVTRACRYEPVFTQAIEQWGFHNDIMIEATRVARPKDKAPVERQVNLTYQRIYAPLRNETFFSLSEMNRAIWQKLKIHNDKNFQVKDNSRSFVFSQEEKHLLRRLPDTDYVPKHQTMAKVKRDYHVTLGEDWVHYSVPYIHIGKQVLLSYDTEVVEIFLEKKLERIATHKRSYRRHTHVTTAEHMPLNHQQYLNQKGYKPEYFLNKAEKVGTATHEYITLVLESRRFTQQTFNACIGILKLGQQYGNDRLEKSCQRALKGGKHNYRTILNILENGMDKQDDNASLFHLPSHDNIRGKDAYE